MQNWQQTGWLLQFSEHSSELSLLSTFSLVPLSFSILSSPSPSSHHGDLHLHIAPSTIVVIIFFLIINRHHHHHHHHQQQYYNHYHHCSVIIICSNTHHLDLHRQYHHLARPLHGHMPLSPLLRSLPSRQSHHQHYRHRGCEFSSNMFIVIFTIVLSMMMWWILLVLPLLLLIWARVVPLLLLRVLR